MISALMFIVAQEGRICTQKRQLPLTAKDVSNERYKYYQGNLEKVLNSHRDSKEMTADI